MRRRIATLVVPGLVFACAQPDGATPATAAIATESVEPARVDTGPPSGADRQPREGALGRQDLPAAVREFLSERMERHGDSMESLLWSSLNLQYELIAQRSEWVAAETGIPRPPQADESDVVNRVLPGRFFDLQEELRRHAGELGRAAERRDDEGIARAYGQVAGTCIRCHGLYMRLPGTRVGER